LNLLIDQKATASLIGEKRRNITLFSVFYLQQVLEKLSERKGNVVDFVSDLVSWLGPGFIGPAVPCPPPSLGLKRKEGDTFSLYTFG
jgi:hypothetical protein